MNNNIGSRDLSPKNNNVKAMKEGERGILYCGRQKTIKIEEEGNNY